MYPMLLKDFDLFVDSQGHAGRVMKVALPKLSRKLEAFIAGGMLGEVEADMGIEKLNASFDMHEWTPELISKFGGTGISGTLLRFRGSLETEDDSTTAKPVEVVFLGRINVLDWGDIERGKMAPLKVEVALTYFKYSFNGKVLIELDTLNNIEVINGVDRLAARRAALA